MTRVHDDYYSDLTSSTDDGSGNGTWIFDFSASPIPTFDPALYTRIGGELRVQFVQWDDIPSIGGQISVNGVVKVTDTRAWWDADLDFNSGVEILYVPGVTDGSQIVTVVVTGQSMAFPWSSVTVRYRAFYTQIYPIVWFNPLTGGVSSSYEGSHLYDSTSKLTCPGHSNTVVHDYQIWGPGSLYSPLRNMARDDGQWKIEAHPRMRGAVDTTSSTLGNRIGTLEGGTYQ